MSESLPAPEAVRDRATTVATDTQTAKTVHVVSAGNVQSVDSTDAGYEGRDAAGIAQLHAATTAVANAEGARLHYPEPNLSVSGPWVILSGLDGRLSTVQIGEATVSIELEAPSGGPDEWLRTIRKRIDAMIEAARPSHAHYPVKHDTQGAFTTGLPTCSLESVSVNAESVQISFSVAMTPSTTVTGLRDRFDEHPWVNTVRVRRERPVMRASPPQTLRQAVESAVEAVLGDWAYEWLREPGAFAWIPTSQKIAIGVEDDRDGPIDTDPIDRTTTVLEHTLSNLEAAQ